MSLNKLIIAFIVILVIFVGFAYFQFSKNPTPKSKVIINTHTFSVKTATNSAQQQQGLSGVKSLPQDQGMLFVFAVPERYAFWMKDMLFPLDIIFIKNNKVVDFAQNVPIPKKDENDANLPVYQPTTEADRVLEVDGGTIKKYDIKRNDTVKIELAKEATAKSAK